MRAAIIWGVVLGGLHDASSVIGIEMVAGIHLCP
jgi:hypothetical protein